MDIETELKLHILPEEIADFFEQPLLHAYGTGPEKITVFNTYYDSAEFQLKKLGYGLRVRKIGEQYLQTIKGPAQAEGALHKRFEWEVPISGPKLEPERITIDAVKSLFAEGLLDKLTPLFTTNFERTLWQVALPDGAEIEVALDQGTISCGQLKEQISEVELELKAGDEKNLFKFARGLQKVMSGLRPEPLSKAARGYALYHKTQ